MEKMKSKKIICFGEVLWDHFPDGKKLGGAPFNVTNSLKNFGADVDFISRVGDDNLGNEILKQMQNNQISTNYIQIDPNHQTGKVEVSLDSSGSAKYDIISNVAWDFIEPKEEIFQLIKDSCALVYGSLAARANSYKTLDLLLDLAKFRVFDLNLRPPFYDLILIEDLMKRSDMLKFNDHELLLIADSMNSRFSSIKDHVKFISEKTNTEIICITMGSKGASLYHTGEWFNSDGFKVDVIDTVGAGDSFLATLVFNLINKKNINEALEKACAMGALVSSHAGAITKISEDDLYVFMHKAL